METLTDQRVRNAEPPAKGRRMIFDGHREAPKGFGLRVNASGRRSFVLRYAHQGRDRLVTIGEYPTWTLKAAREQAAQMRREIDGGSDILERRRSERAELTVKDVAEKFLERKASKLDSYADIRSVFERFILPEIGRRKISEVRRREVIDIVERIAEKHGRQAALTLTYTKQLFSFAEDREIIESSPIASLKPAQIDKSMTPRKRARVLSDQEIVALWTTQPEGMHRVTWLVLKLVLLTGVRPGEAAGMRKDELEGDLWVIPGDRRRKTETAHEVPLTESAKAIIDEALSIGPEHREHVFDARRHPITTAALGRSVKRCADALGNRVDPDDGYWTPHDLRRTCRTGLAALGISEPVAEAVMGHVIAGVRGVYNRHGYREEKRRALEAWEARLIHLAGLAGAEDDGKVIAMR